MTAKPRKPLPFVAVIVSVLTLCLGGVALVPGTVVQADSQWSGDAVKQFEEQVEERAATFRAIEADYLQRPMSEMLRQRVSINIERARLRTPLAFTWCTNADLALRRIQQENLQPTVVILVECDATDVGLQHLAGKPRLQLIKIVGCPGVSREGLERLRRRLPDTRFSVWSSGRSRDISFRDPETSDQ